MSQFIVAKFGGTSVANIEAMEKSAQIAANEKAHLLDLWRRRQFHGKSGQRRRELFRWSRLKCQSLLGARVCRIF